MAIPAPARQQQREFAKAYRDALDGPAATARNDGDVDNAMAGAAKRIEAVYEVPYLAHAPMEPLNATAHYRPDRLDVWIGTQNALARCAPRPRSRASRPRRCSSTTAFAAAASAGARSTTR